MAVILIKMTQQDTKWILNVQQQQQQHIEWITEGKERESGRRRE